MSAVPQATTPAALRLPRFSQAELDNGVRVLAGRRGGVPITEIRLWLPFPSRTSAARARTRLLGKTLLTGTPARSDLDIAAEVQATGGTLSVSTEVDGISVLGSALTTRLEALLALLADVLTGADFPADRVRNRRDRLKQELVISRSRPVTIASEALAHRMYGRHPYGFGLPTPAQLDRTGRASLRRTADAAVRPAGATLVVVSDLAPAASIAAARRALSGWRGRPDATPLAAPTPPAPGPVRIVHRPGAVQTNIRLAGPALPRHDDGYPALALAELAFGGYFASRLVANLREDKGYTYSPRSGIRHRAAASRFAIAADVATEVTGASYLEILYELGRMATAPPDGDELERARRYQIGSLAISTQSQAGLANQVHRLVGAGLEPGWLRTFQRQVERLDAADVAAAARRWMPAGALVGVLVGDADRVVPQLEPLAELEVAAG